MVRKSLFFLRHFFCQLKSEKKQEAWEKIQWEWTIYAMTPTTNVAHVHLSTDEPTKIDKTTKSF